MSRTATATAPHRLRRGAAAVAAAVALAAPLSACGVVDDITGGSAPDPVASIDALKGRTTKVKLDKGFTKALGQLGLSPGTVGRGKLKKGSLVFPITGGNVTIFEPGQVSPYVIGQVQHEGSGFSLSAGGTTVRITNLNVDPGASRVYGDVSVDNKTAASSAYVFKLDGRTLEPLDTSKKNQAVLTGTKVEISDVAAGLLNQTFDTKAVKPGLLVGIATITVKVPSS